MASGTPRNAASARIPLNAASARIPLNAASARIPLNAASTRIPLNAAEYLYITDDTTEYNVGFYYSPNGEQEDVMAIATQQVKKVGGSLMTVIPKEVAVVEGLHEGDTVEITVRKLRRNWLGCLQGLSPSRKEDKLDIKDW